MKYTFTLFTLLTSFAFGQYIKKATITSKKTNEKFEITNVQYLKDGKFIKFNTDNFKNALVYARLKDIDLEFDSIDYSKSIPDIKQTYYEGTLNYPDGLYLTIESFINKTPEAITFEKKPNMQAEAFEYSDDLVNFYDRKGKFPEFQQNKYFAIVQNGDVYFSLKQFSKLTKKSKTNLGSGIPSFAYVRVKAGSENHLYFELPKGMDSDFTSIFAIAGGAIGAAVGAVTDAIVSNNKKEDYSQSYINLVKNNFTFHDINYMKGVIFDVKSKEFFFLKDCSDLDNYIKMYKSELTIDCKTEYTLDKQREIINNIK
ncbi:hypothetical protein SAMN05443634_107225 [Chishuiella changwenlii]|nr:hypothetical protein [Chishuiella changwenlii]SHL27205.1 hypothetical protein SAMN05443634_107225 [Chishuiella changwenlii]